MFALALAFLAATQLLLPGLVEDRIAEGLRRSFGDVKIVRAKVSAYPAYHLLQGRIDSVNLDLRRVAIGDLVVDAVLLDGRNVRLDMGRLVAGEGVRVTDADALRGTFVIAEDDLNEYFWARFNQSRFFRVALDRGQAVLTGNMHVLGRDLAVRVAGEFRVGDRTSVSFVPSEVKVQNATVPQIFLDLIAKEWAVSLELDQDAIPLVVEDLLVEDGRLFIYGRRPARG